MSLERRDFGVVWPEGKQVGVVSSKPPKVTLIIESGHTEHCLRTALPPLPCHESFIYAPVAFLNEHLRNSGF